MLRGIHPQTLPNTCNVSVAALYPDCTTCTMHHIHQIPSHPPDPPSPSGASTCQPRHSSPGTPPRAASHSANQPPPPANLAEVSSGEPGVSTPGGVGDRTSRWEPPDPGRSPAHPIVPTVAAGPVPADAPPVAQTPPSIIQLVSPLPPSASGEASPREPLVSTWEIAHQHPLTTQEHMF